MRHLVQKSESSEGLISGEIERGAERAKRESVCEEVAGGSVISPF